MNKGNNGKKNAKTTQGTTKLKEEFGRRLSQAISEAKISQSDLANSCSLQPSSISNYINGKYYPAIVQLPKIASALAVTIDWLVTGKGPKSKYEQAGAYYQLVLEEMSKITSRTYQSSWVTTRIAQELANQITNKIAEAINNEKEIRTSFLPGGVITDAESMILEKNAKSVYLYMKDFRSTWESGSDKCPRPGRFIDIVASNIEEGCEYFYIVEDNETNKDSGTSLLNHVSPALKKRIQILYTSATIICGFVVLWLRDEYRLSDTSIYHNAFLDGEAICSGRISYIIPPNEKIRCDILVDCEHAQRLLEFFQEEYNKLSPNLLSR